MAASEIFRADGVYIRINDDETIIVDKWAHCDGCNTKHDRAALTTHSELWLCAICK